MLANDRGRSGCRRSGQHHCHSRFHRLIALAVFGAVSLPLSAQSGFLEARIVAGDGQVLRAGAHLTRPLVVEVTDETGTRVDDALVSFRLPEDGVSGTFRNGLKTELIHTDDGGRASLRALQAGGFSGPFQIRVTVAKGEARAGAISTQFIAPDTRKRPVHALLAAHPHLWEAAGLLLAAGAADYIKNVHSAGGAAQAQLPPTIGAPTVVIGKP